MVYEYLCEKCDVAFDVTKTVAELDRPEPCPTCGDHNTKRLFSSRVYFNGASVQNAEFNFGLGMVTKNRKHRDEIARERGLIEVGNETPDTLNRESVVKRQKERDKEWENLS